MEALVALLLVGVVVVAVVAAVQGSRARAELMRAQAEAAAYARDAHMNAQRAAAAEHHAAQVSQRAAVAEHRAASLARYQAIPDAEAAAADIRARATNDAQATLAQAAVAKAQVEAGAKLMLEQAGQNAQRLVADARARADELAADARATVVEAERLEDTVRALKNIVEGYGDAYILPTAGLLDELAEHFGHTEAGASLKAARSRTKAMVKSGDAATC
ncbi:MAG: hypothetical protein KF901_34315, partial [Myxococcales bacterium]|nr:hypothetical protein [Myxococcales bacterium]